MIKILILVSFLTQLSLGTTYTLKNLLNSADEKGVLTKALEKESLSHSAKSRADTASDPFEIFGEGTNARPDVGTSGYEYAVGLSKNIKLGNIQTQERMILELMNETTVLEGEKNILNFRNALKNMYHQHCLDVEKYKSINHSYADLLKLYKKKQKAYAYQEIAKTELMQIESEKNRLYAQVQELKMLQDISKQKVLMLSRSNQEAQLSCRDMYPIRGNVTLKNTFSLSKSVHDKRMESTKARLERYSHGIESVTVSGQYGKELDIDRYTIGVSLPLNFTSERSEQERAAALYKSSAMSYRYEHEMIGKQSLLLELQSRLKSKATMLRILTKNYNTYRKKLLPLVQKSYDLGETSVIEYLLNRQKLYTLNTELYAAKKAYYTTLFALYTLSENKDIK